MRALAIVVCLVVCAGRGRADETNTSAGRIRAQLASEDPIEVAWGLHDAIEGRVAGLDDAIRDALTHLPWQGGDRFRSLAVLLRCGVDSLRSSLTEHRRGKDRRSRRSPPPPPPHADASDSGSGSGSGSDEPAASGEVSP